MLTKETKDRINTCRDILVGKLPDPKSQVLQITNALIYKFMDDQDRMAEQLGGKATFFVNGLQGCAWHKLFNPRLTNQERADQYIEGIEKLSDAKHLPELFREIFKEAYVPFRAANVINLFINEINKFDYHHSEELGNAYEYLLSIMGSQGDAGQFRTPRHLIEFMVDVVDPQKDETIYDPAAGTAGFLIAAYNHILDENDKLTAGDKRKLGNNITGVDISPDMAKMARVNLYLHGFKTPSISEGDTLTDEHLWGHKHDVILANPPFMSPKGGIDPHDKFNIKAKRSEILFVDYIAEHLKLKGRAGVIVPEGIIFQSGTAYKQLRKMLVEDGYLHTVISLPAGVFQPYSGVKTSMLILDRERAKQNDEILFLKIERDGYSLSTQRTKLCTENGEQPEWCSNHSDLPQAIEIVKAWQGGRKKEASIASWVKKEEISDSGDYNLTAAKYRDVDDTKTDWPLVALEEICNVYQPKTITSKDIQEKGDYKVFGANGVIGYYSNYNHENAEVAVTCRGATCGTVNFTEPKCWITGNAMVISPKSTDLDKRYLFHILRATDLSGVITGAAQPQITGASLKPFKIPLPSIGVQQKIAAELDRYQDIIDGARQVVENYHPTFLISESWPTTTLGDVCNFVRGPFGGSLKKEIFVESGYAVYEQSHAIYGDFDEFRYFIDEKKFEEMKRFAVYPGDLIMSCSGTMGKTSIVPDKAQKGIINQALLKLTPDNEKVRVQFLKLWMDSGDFQSQLGYNTGGAAIQNVASVKVLQTLKIPVPSLSEQDAIIENYLSEEADVEACVRLGQRFRENIDRIIDQVWNA